VAAMAVTCCRSMCDIYRFDLAVCSYHSLPYLLDPCQSSDGVVYNPGSTPHGCFKFFDTGGVNFNNAESACVVWSNMGHLSPHLATFHTNSEYTWVHTNVITAMSKDVWIGLEKNSGIWLH